MNLPDFIAAHVEEITSEYEDFARTLMPAASTLASDLLRDHAAQILEAIVADMRMPQSVTQQADKAWGHADAAGADPTPAEIHGTLRAGQGFSMQQAVAEYRALRASVTRLWLASRPGVDRMAIDELVRFNEAVDQALARSMLQFCLAAAKDRMLFMGVLSHELRTPLGTIVASVHTLDIAAAQGRPLPDAIARARRAAGRIESILNDMLDFVRNETQGGMRIRPHAVDLGELSERVVQELRSSWPGRVIQVTRSGDAHGHWDEQRIGQALMNLLNNALKYGKAGEPVQVRISADAADAADSVVLEVCNQGAVISRERLEAFFLPLVRGEEVGKPDSSLGLGLYIVRAIASAHGGEVRATSRPDGEICFSIALPRQPGGGAGKAFGTLGAH